MMRVNTGSLFFDSEVKMLFLPDLKLHTAQVTYAVRNTVLKKKKKSVKHFSTATCPICKQFFITGFGELNNWTMLKPSE